MDDTAVTSVETVKGFDPDKHMTQIQTQHGLKDYLAVQWRLVWFRGECPGGSIETEMLHLDLDRETEEEVSVWNSERRRNEKVSKHANGFVIFRAVVKDGLGGVGTGTKSEKAASFPDFIEKCETGAIGRALAALGYGTQFTAGELDESHRIVDAPVDKSPTQLPKEIDPKLAGEPAIEQQKETIKKLCSNLNQELPDFTNMTFGDAGNLIRNLQKLRKAS